MTVNTGPIVVGGCHRSGTSVLRRILDAHSRIHCGPEVSFFRDFYGDFRKDPVGHARFMHAARGLLPEAKLLEILGHALIGIHERAASLAGKPRWADKDPSNVLYLREWETLLGDQWVFVHVVRNPLDTLASIKEAEFPLTIPSGLDQRIDFYHRYTRCGLEFGSRQPGRYHRIMYEELVNSPEEVVRSLMEWLGEPFEQLQLAFNAVHHEVGLEDPKVASTDHVHACSVGRWRDVLTKGEAAQILSACVELWREIDPDSLHTGWTADDLSALSVS